MLTDEYKLDFSVAVFFVPLFSHIRILCKIELLLFLWECGKPFALPRGGRWPKTCPACRPERHTKGARGPYFGDTAQKPPISAASAEKAPPRRRPKGKGPGGALGALLADLDKENARRGKKGLPPLSYGKYVQLFGR